MKPELHGLTAVYLLIRLGPLVEMIASLLATVLLVSLREGCVQN